MKLELKESYSPFWLIGTGKNKTFTRSGTNVQCHYTSHKKQKEIAKQIFKNNKNVENVYLLTGVQWDNMPSGSKEEFGYIKNKGKLILSKNEIIEADYPKGVSRDPLPKKGVKVYTSPATALENNKGDKNKMKLELKEKTNEDIYIFESNIDSEDPANAKELWDDIDVVKEENGKECKIIKSSKLPGFPNEFEDMIHDIEFDDGTVINNVFGKFLTYKEPSKKVEEGATKLEKGEGDTFENAGTTWKVLAQNEDDTLIVALDSEGNERNKFVVAWGLQSDGSWNQGHYFTDKEKAKKYFEKRAKKIESLKESNNNEYSVKYNVGDVVKFIHAGNEESDETATITGYDNEGFYKVKWSDGEESKGLHDKNLKLVSKSDLKESKIVTPVGNPQTAGSFVNIDIDLDHMEVSDFIVRLSQAIRSEQTAVLEYVALISANGITNEDRAVIEGIMKEEKNHMCALTALLYKQILMNHKENVDEANDEFTLPKFGADIFDENNKLTESISNVLNKIITESSHDGTNDEYTVGDRESGRIYNGLSNTLNVIKNIISTSGEEVVVQNVTLSDDSKIVKESIMTIDDLINELKTDTNYDEIAYHIHEYSKTDKKKALELMDLLFDLETNKSPKECRDEIINHLTMTEDTKIAPKDNEYNIEIDVEYDSDVANQIFDNITREVEEYNKNNEINLSNLGLKDGKFYFTVNKEVDEQMVKDICDEIFDKATNYEYQIIIA